MTPLHMAAAKGHFKTVGYLVDQEAAINVQDKDWVNETILLNLVLVMWLNVFTDAEIRVLYPLLDYSKSLSAFKLQSFW